MKSPFSASDAHKEPEAQARGLGIFVWIAGESGVQKILRSNTRVRIDHSSDLQTKLSETLENSKEFLRDRDSLKGRLPVP